MVVHSISVLFLAVIFNTEALDPCEVFRWLSYSTYRGTACPLAHNFQLCDKYNDLLWYRTIDNSTIVTERPDLFSCATTYPIWMNGSLPISTTEENRIACVNLGYTENGCDEIIPIKVKHCNSFYVYQLAGPSVCNAAYCFGQDKGCPPIEPCDSYYHQELNADISYDNLCHNWTMWVKPKSQSIKTECPLATVNAPQIWLNVSLNVDNSVITNGTICVKDGHECCKGSVGTETKNCSGSFVFKLTSNYECICGHKCGLPSSASDVVVRWMFVFSAATVIQKIL